MSSILELSSHDAVLKAIAEYDQLGADDFLAKHHYGRSRHYFLVHDGKEYDSKAIAGVAHAYQFGSASAFGGGGKGFSGGKAGAAKALEDLGFTIVVRR